MQFLSDVYVTCPECNGTRFRPEVLEVTYQQQEHPRRARADGARGAGVLRRSCGASTRRLQPLADVGLDYLHLGQPLNTLSGGESQRLKLAAAMAREGKSHTLFLFDEPTIGLHFGDVEKLLAALQRLVDRGHSLVVIEHNMEVVKAADYVIDLGPEGGTGGGHVVAAGTPEEVAAQPTARTRRAICARRWAAWPSATVHVGSARRTACAPARAPVPPRRGRRAICERRAASCASSAPRSTTCATSALDLPRDQFIVVTGLSGSGKSTLAFDILYTEGQRRYLDSLSTYARQFVKVLARPNVDLLAGLPPTVAIEQRLSRGSKKSTVATVTEIYHYLRLLYAKIGVQHCTGCGQPLSAQTRQQIVDRIRREFRGEHGHAARAGGARPQGHLHRAVPRGAQARLHAGAHRRRRCGRCSRCRRWRATRSTTSTSSSARSTSTRTAAARAARAGRRRRCASAAAR